MKKEKRFLKGLFIADSPARSPGAKLPQASFLNVFNMGSRLNYVSFLASNSCCLAQGFFALETTGLEILQQLLPCVMAILQAESSSFKSTLYPSASCVHKSQMFMWTTQVKKHISSSQFHVQKYQVQVLFPVNL